MRYCTQDCCGGARGDGAGAVVDFGAPAAFGPARAALPVPPAALVASSIAFRNAGVADVCLVGLVVVLVCLAVVPVLVGVGALPAAGLLAGWSALKAVAVQLRLLTFGARIVLLAACGRAD